MPIFEYACQHCQQRFEKLIRSSETPVACPGCSSAEVRRLPSTFSSPSSVSNDVAPCPPMGCGQCLSPGQCMLN